LAPFDSLDYSVSFLLTSSSLLPLPSQTHSPLGSRFNLLATDLAFIKDFSSELRALDREKILPLQDCIRTYLLPTNVLDPLMILLMLRQNICGSTFFQRLHHEGLSADLKSESDQVVEVNGEIAIHLTKMPEFQFYFNSSPSQLDPHYQTGATLTERGAQYSRQAGSGIAIVEMTLQYDNETQCDIQVGKRADFMNEQLRVSQSDLSLCECSDSSQNDHRFKVKVEVINTTVNMGVIHKVGRMNLYLCNTHVFVSDSCDAVYKSAVGRAITISSSCGLEHRTTH
jgi:hypothetical protein